MSYIATEQSKYDSAPIELYRFDGTFRSYYLTPHAIARTYLGITYQPAAGMTRNGIDLANHSEDQGELEIQLPVNAQIIRDYALQDTPPDLELTIFRIQRDTGDAITYFQGRVKEVKLDEQTSTIVVPSRFREILASTLPTIYVQSSCNHVLFDDRCKVSRAANSQNAEITGVAGRTITVSTAGAFPSGFFTGGEILIPITGERRTIVDQSGLSFQVNFEFSRALVGQTITLTAGCDHSYDGAGGCPKFANMINFGGFPFVPGRTNNVFSNGLD
jgi:uncharacterized phage protein (TIGR02218 family)